LYFFSHTAGHFVLTRRAIQDQAAEREDSEYTVVARRYRPRQFVDLIGQEAIARTLTNAISTGTVAHAYLFTGARGVGKTSCARILAKALNCQQGPTPTPCDTCSSCIAVGNGEDIDVREIDGASNRGIDDVRAIRQEVATRPTRGRYKIYIIDEVHMLTKESFNALLKTLEEPPPHVKFIFATTEVQKVPATIVSRCQRFDFGHLSPVQIAEHLQRIVEAEKRQADRDALEMIARRANGSMRDAQSLLDQAFAFAGGAITAEAVRNLFGIPKGELLGQLADAILRHDAASALKLVAGACHSGIAPADLMDQLIDYWRDLLLVACLGKEAQDLHVIGGLRDQVTSQANSCDVDLLLSGLDVLTQARNRLRGTSHALTLLEAAVVRLARLEQLIPVQQLWERWELSRGPSSATNSRPQANDPNDPKSEIGKKKFSDLSSSPVMAPADRPIEEIWAEVVSRMGLMMSNRLRQANTPAIIGPKTLVIRFPAQYNAAYEYCVQPANRQLIENALRDVAGASWSLRIELEAATSNAVTCPEVAPRSSSKQRLEQTMREHALLARAMEVLDAVPTNIDPEFGNAANDASVSDRNEPEDL
jgi:DNA polymerase-3 subunit gamma/tau